jgi:hypothetical protein
MFAEAVCRKVSKRISTGVETGDTGLRSPQRLSAVILKVLKVELE